jgi:ABC-2 type transport system ATP-binding protein
LTTVRDSVAGPARTPGGESLLSARGVTKLFGKRSVLRGASLELLRGQRVGLVGENGAGKSTLLKILVGLLAPSAGDIERHGRIGYCPQQPLVVDGLTVDENFAFFAAAYGVRRARWLERAAYLLERLHFSGERHKLVSTLSGGTAQKLNLALALLHDPDLLVLDEPYAGFDWATYQRFWELAKELQEAGKSILIVSHLIYDHSQLDRILTLRDGVLVDEAVDLEPAP